MNEINSYSLRFYRFMWKECSSKWR